MGEIVSRPAISVIIPAYNAGKYLMQTLISVRDQTYDGVIETIVVDDCSSDNTYELAESYAGEQQGDAARPVSVLRNEDNSGVAASRNRGVSVSNGEYICFLDSDDVWDLNKISRQIKQVNDLTQKNGAGNIPILYCTARECIDEEGRSTGKVMEVPEVITYKDMLKTNLIPCSSVMVRKDVATDIPMERDDLVEDYINWIRMIRQYGPAAGINEPLLKYRVIKGSRSANKLKAARMHYGALRYLGFSVPAAIGHTAVYAFNGLKKHM